MKLKVTLSFRTIPSQSILKMLEISLTEAMMNEEISKSRCFVFLRLVANLPRSAITSKYLALSCIADWGNINSWFNWQVLSKQK